MEKLNNLQDKQMQHLHLSLSTNMLRVGGFLDGSKHEQQWDTLHQLYKQKIDGLLNSDGQTNFRTEATRLRNYTISQASVINTMCTNAVAGMLWLNFNPDITYIDEVAKALDLDIAIVMAHYGSEKIILVGDDYQLQPTVISNVKTNCFSNHLRYPLFQRLKNLGYPSILFCKQH